MATEQLEVVHVAGVRKSGLLLGESQGSGKEGYWWTPCAPMQVIKDNDSSFKV